MTDKNITIDNLKEILRTEKSFDLITRKIEIKQKNACMFYIDGFVKDDIMEKIIEFFYSIKNTEDLKDSETFLKRCIPYVEVYSSNDINKISTHVLSGVLALVIEGIDKAILLDVRTYPQRETSEPDKNKVLRGSRDGFVETLISNTALIRRRIRDKQLTMQIFEVGKVSKSDVVVCYIENRIDKNLLNKIINKISNSDIESLTMGQQSLVELFYKAKWYNPFPKIKYTERPDVASSSLLDGNIIILVDNSPSALILPTSIFDIMEEADDYYFPPITGTYLRISRYFISLISLILTPLWLLLIQNPQFIPDWLEFIKIKETVNVPVILQLLILELAIDGLRLASVNTPTTISTTLSIIGGIVLSDFAVQTGWFNTDTMLYMAFVAIANYSQPSFELNFATKFMRVILLILTALFNLWGFILGIVITALLISFNRTLSGKSYLYPLIPFNGKEFKKRVLRTRIIFQKDK